MHMCVYIYIYIYTSLSLYIYIYMYVYKVACGLNSKSLEDHLSTSGANTKNLSEDPLGQQNK